MSRRPWTDDEIDRLRTLWAEHRTLKQIAMALGRPRPSVFGKARDLGIWTRSELRNPARMADRRARIHAMREAGMGVAEIGAAIGISHQAVSKALAGAASVPPVRRPSAKTETRREVIRQRYREGAPQAAIGAELGISQGAVSGLARGMGLARSRGGRRS